MDIKEYKECKIQEMNKLSDLIQINLDNLSTKIQELKQSFNNSNSNTYFNIKHLDKWQCEILESIASDITRHNSELWTIGKCIQELNSLCKDK